MPEALTFQTDTGIPDPEIPDKDLQLAQSTAQIIGSPDISPEDVLNIIEKLRTGQFMMHGIKEKRLVTSVMNTGIGNFTPEGGNVNCWCTGSSGFGNIEPSGRHQTYGCTFFHYAHSHAPNSQLCQMTIALTNLPTLKGHNLPGHKYFSLDSEISLPFPVPRSAVHIIGIEIPRGQITWDTNPRALGQAGEAELFKKLAQVLTRFTPGGFN